MLIWKIQVWPDAPSIEDGQSNTVLVQLTKSTASGAVPPEDDDLIFRTREQVEAGGVQGSLSEYFRSVQNPQVAIFQPPLLYAKSSVFLGILGTGNPGVRATGCHVYYTLERIPPELFIAALVE